MVPLPESVAPGPRPWAEVGPAAHAAWFDVLGVRFAIEADEERLLEPLAYLLDRFRVRDGDAPERRLALRGRAADAAGRLECDGRSYDIEGGGDRLVAHAYAYLLHWIFGEVRGFLLLHGAALARRGRGWVLCGESGAGKTTTSCALAAEPGWELLGDDVAPLSLADGRLHPFPKALSLRTGAFLSVESVEPGAGAHLPVLEGGAKLLVHAEALGLSPSASPTTLDTLVFLEPEPALLHPGTPALSVVVHRSVPGLAEEIRALEHVQALRERTGERYQHLDIDTHAPAHCLSQVEELCDRAGALVIGTARQAQRAQPDFEAAPELVPLEADEAVRLFLRRLWGTAQFRTVAALGGGAGLYVRVLRLLAETRCYRLRPGRFQEQMALLRELDEAC